MKVAVVTGGNNGIGLESVKGLAKRGWKVIFGSRDEARNVELVAALQKDKVVAFKLDLSSKASVMEFAGKVRNEVGHIDVLLNNAGVMALPERRMSVDNREMQFAVNHLGHFQLTYLLFDLLKKSPEGRVINVSSAAHFQCSALNVKDLPAATEYSSVDRYYASKLCNVLFTCKLNKLCE
jgi:retinol dehydrogenase-12